MHMWPSVCGSTGDQHEFHKNLMVRFLVTFQLWKSLEFSLSKVLLFICKMSLFSTTNMILFVKSSLGQIGTQSEFRSDFFFIFRLSAGLKNILD